MVEHQIYPEPHAKKETYEQNEEHERSRKAQSATRQRATGKMKKHPKNEGARKKNVDRGTATKYQVERGLP